MSIASLVLAAAPLFEIELRRVEQTVLAPGSLSTAQARITPLGPLLRVQAGAPAEWTWDAQTAQRLTLQSGPRGARLTQTLPGARWQLAASVQALGPERLRVQLRWQQPSDGGAQQWQTTLPVRPGHWTVVAREQPGTAPAPGSLSTQPIAQVHELQLRVTEVPE